MPWTRAVVFRPFPGAGGGPAISSFCWEEYPGLIHICEAPETGLGYRRMRSFCGRNAPTAFQPYGAIREGAVYCQFCLLWHDRKNGG